jgi:hypothetical protein
MLRRRVTRAESWFTHCFVVLDLDRNQHVDLPPEYRLYLHCDLVAVWGWGCFRTRSFEQQFEPLLIGWPRTSYSLQDFSHSLSPHLVHNLYWHACVVEIEQGSNGFLGPYVSPSHWFRHRIFIWLGIRVDVGSRSYELQLVDPQPWALDRSLSCNLDLPIVHLGVPRCLWKKEREDTNVEMAKGGGAKEAV